MRWIGTKVQPSLYTLFVRVALTMNTFEREHYLLALGLQFQPISAERKQLSNRHQLT